MEIILRTHYGKGINGTAPIRIQLDVDEAVKVAEKLITAECKFITVETRHYCTNPVEEERYWKKETQNLRTISFQRSEISCIIEKV